MRDNDVLTFNVPGTTQSTGYELGSLDCGGEYLIFTGDAEDCASLVIANLEDLLDLEE